MTNGIMKQLKWLEEAARCYRNEHNSFQDMQQTDTFVKEISSVVSLFSQIKWERDIAVSQLEALGTELGEDPKLARGRIETDTIEKFANELANKDTLVRYDIDDVMERFGNYDLACHFFREYVDSISEKTIAKIRTPDAEITDQQLEVAVCITANGKKAYLLVQTCATGWDFTFYDEHFKDIDGGQLDNPELSAAELIDQLLAEYGYETDYEVVDYDECMELVYEAEQCER